MENAFFLKIASMFRMSDEAWRRHANPWSVFTRFAAIPAMIIAVWSRAWIDWWALLAVFGVLFWLWINPRVFPAVSATSSWAAKGIFGEKLWLERRSEDSRENHVILRWLMFAGIMGAILIGWGIYTFHVWRTLCGSILLIMAQLWRIDRLGILYETISDDQVASANNAAAVHGSYSRRD